MTWNMPLNKHEREHSFVAGAVGSSFVIACLSNIINIYVYSENKTYAHTYIIIYILVCAHILCEIALTDKLLDEGAAINI